MTCPCGCPLPVKPGNTYAMSACWLRAHPERAKAMGFKGGKEGGRARQETHRQRLLDRFRHLDRDAAIVAAYNAGVHLHKVRRNRARKAAKAS